MLVNGATGTVMRPHRHLFTNKLAIDFVNVIHLVNIPFNVLPFT